MKSITIIITLILATGLTTAQSQNTWTQKTDFGGSARYAAVGFSIGNKGYTGTGYNNGTYYKDFWEYDPELDSWTQKADFGGTARYGAVGFSIGEKGYIGTGDDGSFKKDFYEYNPSTNIWKKKADFGGTTRNGAIGFSIGSKGYIGTGLTNDGSKKDFWQYNPDGNTWTQKTDFGGTARYGAACFSIANKGYVGTGAATDGSKKDLWQYDEDLNTWTQKTDFGGNARYNAVGFALNGSGYMVTGYTLGSGTDLWAYNAATNSWTYKTDFVGAARYWAVGFSVGNKGYIGTGNASSVTKKDFWEYTPEGCYGVTVYVDADGDGYGDLLNSYFAADCIAPAGYVEDNSDCNDNPSLGGANVHPGVCDVTNGNNVDDNCDGIIDDGFGTTKYYVDTDGDGYGAGLGTSFCSNPGSGYSTNNTDCNEGNAIINPGACDISNGIDDDCDGEVDFGSSATTYYLDADGDGYGTGTGTSLCSNPGVGYSTYNTDCNDNNLTVHPGVCDDSNGVDDNCNGIIDDGFWATTYYVDADGDGYGTGTGTFFCSNPGAGYSPYGNDCDDANANIHPGTAEIQNGIDDDCDGSIDNSWTQKSDLGYTSPHTEPAPRSGAVGFSINNKWYVGTGNDETYAGRKDFWELDPNVNTWTQKADFGGTARSSAVGFCIGNKGYIGTGSSWDGTNHVYKDFWEYDPDLNSWIQKADFGGNARDGAVGFNIGSKGYLGTGNSYDGTNHYYKDFWEFNPITNSWTQKSDFGGADRYGAVGFNILNKGYIGTGIKYDANIGYVSLKDFWEYDPNANNWTQKADLVGYPRSSAVGFSIGGKGYLGTGNLSSSYLKDFWEFDPASNIWLQKADFGGGVRSGAVGFSIANKAYVGIGNNTLGFFFNDFWEYDPSENSWGKKPDFGESPRSEAVGFSIGSKGYVGTGWSGTYPNYTYHKDFWEYDPVANIWSQKADFGGQGRSDAVGFSIGSKGYIGTGIMGYPVAIFYNDFWEYDPNNNIWTQKADFGGGKRSNAVGFSIGNKGYIGTGENEYYTYTKDFWEYNPVSNSWLQKMDCGGLARSGASGFSINGKGYLGTGYNNTYTYEEFLSDFWEYDPTADTWANKASFGGGGRWNATGFSFGNKGYIGTGFNATIYYGGFFYYNLLKDFWEYDPISNVWTKKLEFGGKERYNAVGFGIGNRGYIGIGYFDDWDASGMQFSDFWEYDPGLIETTCNNPGFFSSFNITTTSAKLKWQSITGALSYKVRYKIAGTSEWTIVKAIDHTKTLHALLPSTEYVWQVKSICEKNPVVASDWSEKQFFTTKDLRLSEQAIDEITFNVYPNPVSSSATVSFFLNAASDVTIELLDVNGRTVSVIEKKNFPAGNQEVTFDKGSLSAGIYFLQVKTSEAVCMKKLVIE